MEHTTNAKRRFGRSKSLARGVVTIGALTIAAALSAQGISTTVDGVFVNFPDVQPSMQSGRVMVPVRGVFEHMGAEVTWNSSSRTVFAQHGTTDVRLPINSYTAWVNNERVTLDSPATMTNGRVMVPLRFLSESLGANVEWLSASRTVEITTIAAGPRPRPIEGSRIYRLEAGDVIPFSLNTRLSSSESEVGDKFTARVDPTQFAGYDGLPQGAQLQGHVDAVRPKSGTTPGVLSLKFDRVKMADGQVYLIYGKLIGLDDESVRTEDGRIIARSSATNDNLRYVGYGAAAGALYAILTDGNLFTNSVIGAALGFVLGETQKDPSKAHNVVLETGTRFGVRLTSQFSYRAPAAN